MADGGRDRGQLDRAAPGGPLSRTYRIRISANGGAGGSPHRPQVFDFCLTSFYFASLEQVIESADSIPAIAVGLEQQSMAPIFCGAVVIFREKINQKSVLLTA